MGRKMDDIRSFVCQAVVDNVDGANELVPMSV